MNVEHNMIYVKSSSHLFFPCTSFHPVTGGPRTIYKGGSFLRVVIGSSSFGFINWSKRLNISSFNMPTQLSASLADIPTSNLADQEKNVKTYYY